MNKSSKSILVTGDIVLDCHIYGGVKTDPTSFVEPGTVYSQHLGGAALTEELLRAAADARGLIWDQKYNDWTKQNKTRTEQGKELLPRPDDVEPQRPEPIYNVDLDLETGDLPGKLPTHLHSYGVWTDQPSKKGAKDRVWRVNRNFGYGPTESASVDIFFRQDPERRNVNPDLTLIDDGGIIFRNEKSRKSWPKITKASKGLYLLKMSRPLCRGDLWASLKPVMDRLIVVVSAMDLRREDAKINSRLSWEQCAQHTITALENDPIAHDLLRAAHVVVSFRSAGALWYERGRKHGSSVYRLLFDPEMLEGDYALKIDGTVYGFQTCLTAGIAHHLMRATAEAAVQSTAGPTADKKIFEKTFSQGLAAGLLTRRRLLDLGHGNVEHSKPGFPIRELGHVIAGKPGGYITVEIPQRLLESDLSQWTILNESEAAAPVSDLAKTSLAGLAQLTARYGFRALSHVPAFRSGNLFTVDRSEIESYRTLQGLISAYEGVKVQKKPLSIGVFGPPGAGKSFGVKALAKGILGDKVPFLEFNLSQFKNPDELIGAFHRVRDAVLGGITPVAFWDEFDSQNYRWLQYLLAPMQDGAFQEGQITHPIGKCIFIFAGGTSPKMDVFGVKEPKHLSEKEMQKLSDAQRADRREDERHYRDFRLLKGPDFISRLHGYLNVLGPNPCIQAESPDLTWPVRRAIILRGILQLKENEELDIDPGLLNALLTVSMYHHGARSFERIVSALRNERKDNRLNRSSLPPQALLDCDTCAEEFNALLIQRDSFKNHPDLERLAAAVHYHFLEGAKKSKLEAEINKTPSLEWTIHPSIQKDYDKLSPDFKGSNRAAARRIPDHLALIGYSVVPQLSRNDRSWEGPLTAAIHKHIERLALAEHLGWGAERTANGWTYGEIRDNNAKHHPLLVSWAKLSPSDQEKDRAFARSIPALLKISRYKAVLM